ncbi:MAG: zinc ribbon domain-containing protein [Candidatus Lokiarchaeota archaeon]|nr:zinc ribbon domain-containing protein [Candidatus Lokiarchaeota archaeon]
MSKVRDFVWLLPFIGSILAAISLFTPAAVNFTVMGQVFRYMDGFYIVFGPMFGPTFGFIDIPVLIIIGIICTILISICTIILFISSLTHRKKDTPGSWLALGIILMGGTIYYIAGTEMGYMMYLVIRGSPPESFWGIFVPSFAVIAPFITSGLSIVAFIIGKSTGKEEVEIKPISKEEIRVSEPITQPIPIEDTQAVKFCPACGEKIPHAQAQFCPSCGYDLKKEE